VVCVRMPPAAGRKHRTSRLQTVPAVTELAAELHALGEQMVSMEATQQGRLQPFPSLAAGCRGAVRIHHIAAARTRNPIAEGNFVWQA
jgi:hypothetical protein